MLLALFAASSLVSVRAQSLGWNDSQVECEDDLAHPDQFISMLQRGFRLQRERNLKSDHASIKFPVENEELRSFRKNTVGAAVKVTTAPKLALLFLTDDRVRNSDLWLAWLAEAKQHRQEIHLLIHASGLPNSTNRSALFHPPELRSFLVHETVPTSWCGVVQPMDMLINLALQDAAVTHLAFASGDALPVKPLRWMHSQLQADAETRMCTDTQLLVADTWWVMKRADAEILNGKWGSFEGKGPYWPCEEETAFYRGMISYGRPVRVECTTFAWFEYAPLSLCNASAAAWCYSLDRCNCTKLTPRMGENETAFVKIVRPGPPSVLPYHPVSFVRVSPNAWSELLQSPFWFARKFDEGAVSLSVHKAALGSDQ